MSRLSRSAWGLDAGPDRLDWRARAACAKGHDPELWSSTDPIARAAAAAICRGCPVLADCLAWAQQTPAAVVDTVAGGVLWVREKRHYGTVRPAKNQPGRVTR